MRTHTTNTDIRVIAKMHRNGFSVKEIVKTLKIDGREVQKIINVKCGTPAEVETEVEVEAAPAGKPTPVQKRVAQKKAAKKKAAVDPIS